MRSTVRFIAPMMLVVLALPLFATPASAGATFKPDAWIRLHDGTWIGDNLYDSPSQTVAKRIRVDQTIRFDLIAENDGDVVDSFIVTGCDSGGGFAVNYISGTHNISDSVKAGLAESRNLNPGARQGKLAVTIRRKASAPKGTIFACYVTFESTGGFTLDTVLAEVKT